MTKEKRFALIIIGGLVVGIFMLFLFLYVIPTSQTPSADYSVCHPDPPSYTNFNNCTANVGTQHDLASQANLAIGARWLLVFIPLLLVAFVFLLMLPRFSKLVSLLEKWHKIAWSPIVDIFLIIGFLALIGLLLGQSTNSAASIYLLVLFVPSYSVFGTCLLLSFVAFSATLTGWPEPEKVKVTQEIEKEVQKQRGFPEKQEMGEGVNVLERGMELQRQRKYEEALPFLKEAVQRDDQSYLAWTSLADVLNNLSEYTEALTAVDHALLINPQYASAWSVKGFALNGQGYEDKAIEACNTALAIEPNHTYALYTKGLALALKGELDVALATYDRALRINPTYTNALLGKCLIFFERDEPQEMLRLTNRIIGIDPGEVRAWDLQGMAHYMKKDIPEALNACDQALHIDPHFAHPWTLKGAIYADEGEYKKALDALNQALEIDPHETMAQEIKTRILQVRRKHVAGAVGMFSLRLLVGIVRGIVESFIFIIKSAFKP